MCAYADWNPFIFYLTDLSLTQPLGYNSSCTFSLTACVYWALIHTWFLDVDFRIHTIALLYLWLSLLEWDPAQCLTLSQSRSQFSFRLCLLHPSNNVSALMQCIYSFLPLCISLFEKSRLLGLNMKYVFPLHYSWKVFFAVHIYLFKMYRPYRFYL